MITKLINGFLEYFKHESTFKGLIAIATAVGVTLSPELQGAIVAAGLSLIGLIQVFIDDRDETK